VPFRIAGLVRTAPNWATADPRSPEVTAWLDRARAVANELRPAEAGALRVHLQFMHNDVARHGPEVVEILRRVAGMRRPRAG
jgi:phage terminase Nu1 subunit (DNA packaging protein)